MNITAESDQLQSRVISPVAEFRRWLVIACAVAIAGTCLDVGLQRLFKWQNTDLILFVALFTVSSACEGWLQFDSWHRRFIWVLAGAWTGVGVSMSARWAYAPGLGMLAFMIPAITETVTARDVRHHPWAWLIVTTELYGSMPIWSDFVGSTALRFINFAGKFFNYPATAQLGFVRFTSVIAVILITRAFVGSFIASRKEA